MITLRDLSVAAVAASAALWVNQTAKSPASVMGSSIFDWATIAPQPTKVGAVRKFFQAPTATLDELECHVTTLRAGEEAHPPHRHQAEEIIIVKEGTVESLVNGESRKVGHGSVIFQASNQLHTIRNVGEGPATYHVVQWKSPGTVPKALPAK